MQIDSLPPLANVLRQFNIVAKKKFGQNFLLDFNILMKIANQAQDLENCCVLEIGAGPGGLTRTLLAKGAKVFAVEYEKNCLCALEQIKQIYKDRLFIANENALQNNFMPELKQFANGREIKIISNLPYNIATKLFTNWLLAKDISKDIFYQEMILMFQQEVALRICSQQGEKHWGRLGLLSSLLCEREILFSLEAEVFTPPPKVMSSLVKITPNKIDNKINLDIFQKISKTAFGQRRKMLRQSLKALGGETLLNKAGIEPTLRAQDLTLEDYLQLTKIFMQVGQ